MSLYRLHLCGRRSSAERSTRHPFGRIPAFEHAGFSLYETSAIARYVDEVFEGPKLQPSGARGRARCNQLISVADNYAYSQLVWGIYVERVSKPGRGAVPDEAKITATIPKAKACLKAMSDLMDDNPWLAGTKMTLADLYAAPMFDYFLMAPEGRDMIQQHQNLATWWSRMSSEAIHEGNYSNLVQTVCRFVTLTMPRRQPAGQHIQQFRC